MVARRPNLLLLDEPTNHLDIEMRQALTVALQGFDGGLVVVSHDRHLIKSVADTLWLVADGRLQAFEGDLDDYQLWLRSRGKTRPERKQAAAKPAAAARRGPRTAPAPPKHATRRDPKSRLRQRLDKVEASIAAIAEERRLLDAELAANPLHDKLKKRLANLAERRRLPRSSVDGDRHRDRSRGIVIPDHRVPRACTVPLTISASAWSAARL